MTARSTRSTMTFKAPFQLPGFEELPAGTYAVDTDEEAFEGNVRTFYHRVGTTLRVPTGSGFESRSVQPQDLEQALRHDELTAVAPGTDNIGDGQDDAPAPPPSTNLWHWVPLWARNSRPDGRAS